MRKKPKLVTQYLENISRDALESHGGIIRRFVGRRTGVYSLYRKGKLYYAGLASNLRSRLKTHLKDRHKDSWDSFSVYLTIGDHHLRELESLILRVVQPPGNHQLGKFSGAENLWRKVRRDIADEQRLERDRILGRESVVETRSVFKRTIRIRGTYKKKLVRARLRKDGKVRWSGKTYSSPSAAATAVRGHPTNGRWFWKYERGPGEWVRISELKGS